MARIYAVLRRLGMREAETGLPLASAERPAAPTADSVDFADVQVDVPTRRVSKGGEEVKLTHLEFELLIFFLRNPSRVLSRDRLLREVWGLSSGSARTVDNFVGQLRAKLEDDAEAPRHFITVRGSGYRFDP
jgi:DNA-binding response OmpR family regulator